MLTGRQYKESLKDGRKVYFEGRLIEDFGSEPAMAIPLQAIADGSFGKIAVTYFEWAGTTSHHVVVPWTIIANRADAEPESKPESKSAVLTSSHKKYEGLVQGFPWIRPLCFLCLFVATSCLHERKSTHRSRTRLLGRLA